MPITASCGNCGKTYQAPDRLGGKTVRCKECGEMFRIDAADTEAGEPDLDALERSFADESLATGGATAMGGTVGGTIGGTAVGGPSIDGHGRARIERGAAVDGVSIRGDAGSNHLRSNFRHRYPGAKQVDQFLPWVLVALCGYLVGHACMISSASGEERPTTGVGLSRLAILLAAYLFIIWPASHVALTMATTRLRMSMPRAAIWRSFAGFTPILMLGGGLFVFSGGDAVGLIMGLLVGATVAIGAVALLFRMFPNEVPTAAGYTAAGSVGGALFAAAAIFAINLVGASLARMDKAPTLFVSPIAIGLPWVDKPAPGKTVVARKTSSTTAPTPTGTTTAKPTDVPLPPRVNALQTLPVPRPDGEDVAALVQKVEVTPIQPGFDELITPPVASNAIGVIRNAGGGSVEVWDRSTWKQPIPARGRGFDRSQGALAINTTARAVWRLVHSPADRLEQIGIGNGRLMPPVDVPSGGNRTVYGFDGENDLLVRVYENGALGFEKYDVAAGLPVGRLKMFANAAAGAAGSTPIQVDAAPSTVRLLPDGSGVLIACRDTANPDYPAALALYAWPNTDVPAVLRRVTWNDVRGFRPVGMAITSGAKVALLLDSSGEAYLTVWEMRAPRIEGASTRAREKPLLDRRLDQLMGDLAPQGWSNDVDPLLWLDDQTLLLFGNIVLDADTGRRLGTLGMKDVSAQYAGAGGTVLLVQRNAGLSTLVQVTLDPAALAARRK